MERQGKPISVDENGFMRLSAASEMDAGKYTCLVDISLDGRKYTAARSIQLTIENGMYRGSLKPEVSSDWIPDGDACFFFFFFRDLLVIMQIVYNICNDIYLKYMYIQWVDLKKKIILGLSFYRIEVAAGQSSSEVVLCKTEWATLCFLWFMCRLLYSNSYTNFPTEII